MNRLLMILVALLVASGAVLAAEVRQFDSPEQEEIYQRLIQELRCTVCQNQNIADSNADLAKDLRDRVYAMLQEGKSENEILDFMVQRYGNFVLYRPPAEGVSLVIWILPFLVLLFGAFLLVRVARAHAAKRVAATPATDDDKLARAERLLEDEEGDRS